MKSLFIGLMLATIATPAIADDPVGHAMHHSWYQAFRQPGTGMSCCNNSDCRPAQSRVTADGVQFLIAGKWITPEPSKIIETETPGGDSSHWCGVNENDANPTTYCAIIPRRGV